MDRPWKRLKACRVAAGYKTAKAFSDFLGVTQATYNNHERPPRREGGKGRAMSPAAAARYAEAFRARGLDVTADWLLHNAGEPPVGVLPAPAGGGRAALRDGGETGLTVDRQLLARVVEAAEAYLFDAGLEVPPARKGELYIALYELVADDEGQAADGPVDLRRYDNVIRLAR